MQLLFTVGGAENHFFVSLSEHRALYVYTNFEKLYPRAKKGDIISVAA